LIGALASHDAKTRIKAYKQARTLMAVKDWAEARTPSWAISEADALAVLRAAQKIDFPPPPARADWEDGLHEVLSALWRSPYPSLTPEVALAYPRLHNGRRQCALLALLGAIGTREAAAVFAGCIREHGWPDTAYFRVFEELEKLLAHGDLLLPDVITGAGKATPYVGDAILGSLNSGVLKLETVGARLETLAPYVLKSMKQSLKSVGKHQDKPGIAWRFAERYHDLRHRASMFLDLAGYLQAPKLAEPIRQAAEFTDPRIVTYASLALLRRGEDVAAETLERAAASHEMRTVLFNGLRALGMVARFPKTWRSWEAFGAARMVEWLLYPAELGREPDELVLEHVEPVDAAPGMVLYVWKFRVEGEPWLAGISGPHFPMGEPAPLEGTLTFSRFDEWDSATPVEHLERCVGTVQEIREGSASEDE
jgi:hypothetical protein